MQIGALCSAVQDTNILVQRIVLDFILVGFPMHSKELLLADRTNLVTSVLNVLLRRDMSLNRRFCTWLLGENDNKNSEMDIKSSCSVNQKYSESQHCLDYFEMFSRDILINALCIHFHLSENRSKESVAKPFRIIISLLDYPLIGGRILESLFLEILRFSFEMYSGFTSSSVKICNYEANIYCLEDINNPDLSFNETGNGHKQDVAKSLVLFYSSLDSKFIWEFFVMLYANILSEQAVYTAKDQTLPSNMLKSATMSEMTCLMEFLLTKISLVSRFAFYIAKIWIVTYYIEIYRSKNKKCIFRDFRKARPVRGSELVKTCFYVLVMTHVV